MSAELNVSPMNPTRESLLMLCFGVFAGVAVAVGAFFIVPNFQEVFKGFGTELPLATKLLLATYQWWGVVPGVTVVLWTFWPNAPKRGMVALIFGMLSSGLLSGFLVWAAYMPIFRLGSTVG